jgi:hypothetical protein
MQAGARIIASSLTFFQGVSHDHSAKSFFSARVLCPHITQWRNAALAAASSSFYNTTLLLWSPYAKMISPVRLALAGG